MPKEITHWTLAEKAYAQLESGNLKEEIKSFRNVYLVGSVIFDSPLYTIFGKHRKDIYNAGLKLHALHNGNPYAHLLNIVNYYDKDNLPAGTYSFMAGAITHMIADSTYHPMIHYFCGDVYADDKEASKRARTRHHKLETFLDLYNLKNIDFSNSEQLYRSVDNCEISRDQLLELTSILLFGTPNAPEVDLLIKQHGFFQGLFKNKLFYIFGTLLNMAVLNKLEDYQALIYPKYTQQKTPFFKNNISYKQPVTGEVKNHTIKELENSMIAATIKVFNGLEDCRASNDSTKLKELLVELSKEVISLNTGLPLTSPQKLKVFDISTPIDTLVKKPCKLLKV